MEEIEEVMEAEEISVTVEEEVDVVVSMIEVGAVSVIVVEAVSMIVAEVCINFDCNTIQKLGFNKRPYDGGNNGGQLNKKTKFDD